MTHSGQAVRCGPKHHPCVRRRVVDQEAARRGYHRGAALRTLTRAATVPPSPGLSPALVRRSIEAVLGAAAEVRRVVRRQVRAVLVVEDVVDEDRRGRPADRDLDRLDVPPRPAGGGRTWAGGPLLPPL